MRLKKKKSTRKKASDGNSNTVGVKNAITFFPQIGDLLRCWIRLFFLINSLWQQGQNIWGKLNLGEKFIIIKEFPRFFKNMTLTVTGLGTESGVCCKELIY